MRLLTVATFVALAIAACGGDSSSLSARCEKSCTVAKDHPCAGQQTQCIADCKALAAQAESGSKLGKSCGDCIADSFSPSVKTSCTGTSCCNGYLHLAPGDPACLAKCFEADGGASY